MKLPISARCIALPARTIAFAVSLVLIASSPNAHVDLLSPNGGESIEAGTYHPIVWRVAVGHPMFGWQLWYSTADDDDNWAEIEYLPPGDTSTGAIHTYYWHVPELASSSVRIRIMQDTTPGQNKWEDRSAGFFSISGSCCAGIRGNIDSDLEETIAISDLVYLVTWMFQGGSYPYCAAESNLDGSISTQPDIADLIYLVNYMFNGGSAPVSCP